MKPVSPQPDGWDAADGREVAPLVRWALRAQVAGQEPSPAAWSGIRARSARRRARRADPPVRWSALAPLVIVLALTLSSGLWPVTMTLNVAPPAVAPQTVAEGDTVEPEAPPADAVREGMPAPAGEGAVRPAERASAPPAPPVSEPAPATVIKAKEPAPARPAVQGLKIPYVPELPNAAQQQPAKRPAQTLAVKERTRLDFAPVVGNYPI